MSRKRKSRSIPATPEGIKLLEGAKASVRDDEGKPLTYERIAEKAGVSDKTVQRFFNGEGVDRSSAIAIIKALELKEKDVLPSEEFLVSESIERIEAQSTSNSERPRELIEKLETALSELKASKDATLQAMDWLKANRGTLPREAAQSALENYYDNYVDEDYSEEIEQFSKEIRKYLQLIYYCLEAGTWEFMDRAMQEASIPMNRDSLFYVDALKFIKEQKVSKILSSEEAKELTLCLDYLINIIPIRF